MIYKQIKEQFEPILMSFKTNTAKKDIKLNINLLRSRADASC